MSVLNAFTALCLIFTISVLIALLVRIEKDQEKYQK